MELINKSSEALITELPTIFDRLKTREEHLSYSKLKHLTSPVNFTLNLLSKKSASAGMTFGSLVDCLITEEDKFDKKYFVLGFSITSDNQKKLIEKTLEGDKKLSIADRFRQAFSETYKRGKAEDYAHVLQYCQLLELGLTGISQDEYDKAKEVAENLKSQPQIEDLLAQNEGLQKFLEFEYKGWKFRGILDMFSCGGIYDFKYSSRFNPDTFHREINDYGYDLQMAIYRKGLEITGVGNSNTKGHFIVYDAYKNFSVMEFGEDYQYYAERKLDVYIKRIERIIKENAWFRSYDFFEPNRVIRKPAYIKGFADE